MDNNTPAEHSSFPRRLVLAMAVVAAVCFGTAWLKFNAGANHYEAYVEAYVACVNDPLFGSQAAEICKTTPQVRNHFTAHNAAYASVAPFLSLAVALTVAVILSPLTHRGSRWVEKRLARGHQMEAAADAS
jgi:hypothetical protein